MRLTAAQERYLLAVYDLTAEAPDAGVSEIAARVGVSKATASAAMGWLRKNGLAEPGRGQRVALTEHGGELAVLSYGKTRVLRRYLIEVLGVPENVAEEDAAALEPVISMKAMCAFCRRLSAGSGCGLGRGAVRGGRGASGCGEVLRG